MHTREEVTAAIRELWSDVLELGEIPGDLDFFAAGGSSLKSLILLTELNDAFETELEIAELVGCRTIDRQAEAVWHRLTRETTARDGQRTVLVPLAEGGEEDVTFVAVHDVGGDVYGYTSLAGELAGRADLYGLKLAHERFEAPQALSLPELAAEYVTALESAFGDARRFVLVGWSLGGLVGFEMAKLLDRRQRPAARLVLLDSPYELDLPGPDDDGFRPAHERKLLEEFGDGGPLLGDEATAEELWRAVAARLDAPAKERLAAELQHRFPLLARVIPHLSSLNAREFVCYVNRFRSVFQAGRTYRPEAETTAPIELLTASRSQNFDPRWAGHTSSKFERRSLDGDHFSILDRGSAGATALAILGAERAGA